jgi:hypothetical protein
MKHKKKYCVNKKLLLQKKIVAHLAGTFSLLWKDKNGIDSLSTDTVVFLYVGSAAFAGFCVIIYMTCSKLRPSGVTALFGCQPL